MNVVDQCVGPRRRPCPYHFRHYTTRQFFIWSAGNAPSKLGFTRGIGIWRGYQDMARRCLGIWNDSTCTSLILPTHNTHQCLFRNSLPANHLSTVLSPSLTSSLKLCAVHQNVLVLRLHAVVWQAPGGAFVCYAGNAIHYHARQCQWSSRRLIRWCSEWYTWSVCLFSTWHHFCRMPS